MKNSFIYNPYNILGLSVESTQKDIATRIRNIGKITAVEGDVSFDYDLYISSKDRTSSLIKDCEARLNDAFDRMTDFFFWFTINSEEDRGIFEAIRKSDVAYMDSLYSAGDFFKKKNAAIGESIIFEKSQNKTDFENALIKWAGFIDDDTFWKNWTKLYKTFDYLDTSSRLLENYREDIFEIISEKFLVVSELDDAIDAQIVNRYISVPSTVFDKAIEPHIREIREIKSKLSVLRSSNSLLSNNYVITPSARGNVLGWLEQAESIHGNLKKASQDDAPKVAHELNDLWNDFLTLAILAHNKASQHDKTNVENLEFQINIIDRITKFSTDSLLNDKIKKNREIALRIIADLNERKQTEPYYSQLKDLFEKLTNVSADNETMIDRYLTIFVSAYDKVTDANLLRFESVSQLVTACAGIFNWLAIDINNASQDAIGRQFKRLELASQYEKQSIVLQIRASAPMAINKLKFAQSILSKIRTMQIDPQLKATINSNYSGVAEAINALNKIINPPANQQSGSSSGLSPGCIGQIVIGVIVLICIIVASLS